MGDTAGAAAYRAWPNLSVMFFEQARRHGARNFLWRKREGSYRPLTWREVDSSVRELSRGLRGLGFDPGDRILLVAENCPEWLIADVAIMAAGAITVPAYTTNTPGDHRHVLRDSGARGAIVSTRALARPLLAALAEAPDCKWLVVLEPPDTEMRERAAAAGVALHAWDDICAKGRELPDDVEALAGRAGRRDVACFIYTSGTGGAPKGVMLSHGAILHNCMGAHELLKPFGLDGHVFLSFLPLSHSYEHTAGQFFPISIGAEIYYAEGAEHLLRNLPEARPTLMTAVPRLYEAMHQRIRLGVAKEGGIKAKLFELAERLGRKRFQDPASLTLLERLQDRLVERLVRDKVRARFGGRLLAMVSGGAALNPEIGLFFTALGLRVLQGYGQTEAAPIVSANPPHRPKMDTVGPPFTEVELRIADDGEILVRGELVMNGYWNDPDGTARALRDGWLHTGDVGEIDADGYLKITDRKKDIIVLSGGDNVSPARIQGLLTLQPEIAQAMVYGDKHPHLVALIVPDPDFAEGWAAERKCGSDPAALAEDAGFHEAVLAAVERVNRDLQIIERIRRFVIAPEPLTIENQMLTPTMKVRRHKVLERYRERLEALYHKG